MRELRLAAVGNSRLVAEEIRSIAEAFLGIDFPIWLATTKTLKEAEGDTFYVSSTSLLPQLSKIIPAEQLFGFDLHPAPEFFRSIMRIPVGETVYVFNNRKEYAELLIAECRALGMNNLKFRPIIYSELASQVVCRALKEAKYIVGVDRFTGTQTLFSSAYRASLRPDVRIIAGRRAASATSAGRLLTGIAEYYLSELSKEADSLKKQRGGKKEIDVSAHIRRLYAKLSGVTDTLTRAHSSILEAEGEDTDADFAERYLPPLTGDVDKDISVIDKGLFDLGFLHQKLRLLGCSY